MKEGIKVTYLYHDGDIIEIYICVGNGKFRGSANVYEGRGQLLEAAATLLGFPKNSEDTREVAFGAAGPAYAGGYVHLAFSCKDLAGHASFRATVEEEYENRKQAQNANICVDFEPASLDQFLIDLQQIERNLAGSAILIVS